MTKDEALKMALEALVWATGSGDFGEGGQAREGALKLLFPAIQALRQALDQSPDTTKMIDTGIDRGAWSDVPDATKWVDELRGDDEQPEQEPVAWMSPGKERLEFSTKSTVYGSHTIPLYTAPPKQPEPYDQTALELCDVCGWKTLIPDEGCLNCERGKPWAGLTDEEIAEGAKQSWVDKQAFESAVWWAEEKLKEKNHD